MSRNFGLSEFLFILGGLRWTVALALVAMIGGSALGLLVAVLRTAPQRPLRWLARGFIELFQGTPVLMQLFLAYYGLAVVLDLRIAPWPAVGLALTLNAAAFLGEIWRGSIEAIPRAQWESAQCLALPYLLQLRLVILPQALRISIPATVGFLVQLVKSTAIASLIGFVELTRAGQLMTSVTFEPMVIYPLVAALYFAICWPLSLASQVLERRTSQRPRGARWSRPDLRRTPRQ
jgi:polar amino acid transport system permease protein